MTVSPKSASTVQPEPAAVGGEPTQDEDKAQKRRLSDAADAVKSRKKSRAASEDPSDGGGGDDSEDQHSAASDADDSDCEEQLPPELAAPGPHVFYMWVKGILSVVDGADYSADVVLKSTALEAYRKVADMPKYEQFGAVGKYIDAVKSWSVSVDDEARETPSAKAMFKKWEEFMDEEARQRKERGKEGAEDKARSQWCAWYEVTLRRDRPQKGAPGVLEITLCSQGDDDAFWRWYFVDVNPVSEEGETTMELVGQYIADRDY